MHRGYAAGACTGGMHRGTRVVITLSVKLMSKHKVAAVLVIW